MQAPQKNIWVNGFEGNLTKGASLIVLSFLSATYWPAIGQFCPILVCHWPMLPLLAFHWPTPTGPPLALTVPYCLAIGLIIGLPRMEALSTKTLWEANPLGFLSLGLCRTQWHIWLKIISLYVHRPNRHLCEHFTGQSITYRLLPK